MRSVCLDCIVTVVDARNIQRQLADARPDGSVNEAQQQVAFADVVLLNKVRGLGGVNGFQTSRQEWHGSGQARRGKAAQGAGQMHQKHMFLRPFPPKPKQTATNAMPSPACLQTDLADEGQLRGIEGEIRGVNAEAAITRCQRCEIDLSQILNTGIYTAGMRPAAAGAGAGAGGDSGCQQPAAADGTAGAGGQQQHTQQAGEQQQQQEQQCGDPSCEDPGHQHDHHHQHQHRHQDDASSGGQHDGRVGTVTLSLPGRPLDLPRLRHWLDTLLWEQTAETVDLFRIKGLLHVAGSGYKHVLQAVHELYDIVEGPAWREGEPRGSKLVFIGRRLRREALLRDLQACLAEEQPL